MLDLKITFVTYAQITDLSYILNTDQLSDLMMCNNKKYLKILRLVIFYHRVILIQV